MVSSFRFFKGKLPNSLVIVQFALEFEVLLLNALLFGQRLVVALVARLRADHDPRRPVDVLHDAAQLDLRRFATVLGVRTLRTAVLVVVVRVRRFRLGDSVETVVLVGRMQRLQDVRFVPFDRLRAGLGERRIRINVRKGLGEQNKENKITRTKEWEIGLKAST